MRRIVCITFCALLGILFTRCGGGPQEQGLHPAPAALTIISGNAQTGTVGQQLPTELAVRVLDSAGAPMNGVGIQWGAAAGSGSVLPAIVTSGSDGIARTFWTVGTTAGVQHANAATAGLVANFNATAQPGAAASLQISGPSTILTDDVVSLNASAVDAYGNPTGVPVAASFWATDEYVVKVNPDNTVLGMYPGTKMINAAAGDLTGSRLETVNPRIAFKFGTEETVFRYATDSCAQYDLPDQPARIIRLADGSLMLIDSDDPVYYASYGPDFNSLRRSCTPIFYADHDLTPQSYNNNEWLWAPYRDGSTIHAIIHNEYHDPFAPNCSPGNPTPGNPCWYNSLTYASSTDGGRTFTHSPAPQHVLAPAPWVWDPEKASKVYGYFESSNIIRAPDGYFYAVFRSIPPESIGSSLCMMRTLTLADPTSWRAWDGEGFNLAMKDPYISTAPAACHSLVPEGQAFVNGNLTYNSYLHKYMLLASSIVDGTDPLVCGIAYMTSTDLLHWTREQIMLPGHVVWPPCNDALPMMIYGAVIDHNDTTVNFVEPGRSFYLYYTRFNDWYLDRDLVRVPVTMTEH